MFKYGTARQDDVHNLLAEDELEMEFQQHNNSSSVIESDIGSQSPLSEVALSDNSQDGTHPSDDDDDEDEEGAVCFGVKRFVGLCIFLTSLSSCLLGYDIGIMAGAKRFIKKDLGFSGTQIEIILGSLNLVAAFGGLLSGKLADSIGRRKTLAFACTLFILGSGLMVVLHQQQWEGNRDLAEHEREEATKLSKWHLSSLFLLASSKRSSAFFIAAAVLLRFLYPVTGLCRVL
eukprot:m.192754 g.192754  ORF g.192754 m.192754 type:complete len:232 (-) comp25752_c0_seq1:1307-2002(-)